MEKYGDKYSELVSRAVNHELLFHYTRMETLRFILEGGSLRLSRIDKVNDPMENERITSLWRHRIFVACFTHRTVNEDYFWRNYGNVRIVLRPEKLGSRGVFLDAECQRSVPKEPPYEKRYEWKYLKNGTDLDNFYQRDITMADVYYTDDLKRHIAEDGFEENAGLIKLRCGYDHRGRMRDWSIEAETRLRIALNIVGVPPIGDKEITDHNHIAPRSEYLYVPFPWEDIETIELSPYCSDKEKKCFASYLKSICFPRK